MVVIGGTLTAHRYVDGILRTVLLPFHLQYPGLIFQKDKAKPHTTRVAMNCLTAYQTLPWPTRSPYPSQIEDVWDMMGR
ncbi:transposable element Tc1 transposase [Trichonephila clavipes]|uniref:Transposable element Tc1 transposase n=1 Tax=Trichonephila clavipes TaxID=2585209 RepID=A0A8X6VAR4_TRICX|nr:transposable element Tc1 transposase [Trichonephila clavipes]